MTKTIRGWSLVNKLYYSQKHTKDELNFIKKVAKNHNVSIYFRMPKINSYMKDSKVKCQAACIPFEGKIFLDLKQISTIQDLLIIFFHELQHCINYKNKKYFNYHKKPRNKKEILHRLKLTIRAELYTDIKAKEHLYQHIPIVPYISSYKSKKVQNAVRYQNQITKIILLLTK